MNKNNKLGIILIVLAVIFTIIGSTFAYWSWTTNSSQLTSVTFTIASGFTCRADGGGNITSNDVSLAPAECTNSNYAIKRTVKVSTTQRSGATIYLDMNLKVNSISANLAASSNFKYALTTDNSNCESGIMAEGTFYGAEANDELPLLTNERYTQTTSNDTFYLWIWLDKEETDNSTQNGSFEFTLSGECTDQEPAKIYAPWGAEVDQYTRINFRAGSSNGQGLYLFQQSEHDTHPIYYYRGNISNNNVLFGSVCWKIVRTTETGGVKLVYNGLPTSGSCLATTGMDTQLSIMKPFNTNNKCLADVGYMYGSCYTRSYRNKDYLITPYKYGNSFSYSGGTYTLVDTITSTGSWGTDYNTLSNNHYTCFNDTGVCSSLYYIYYTVINSGAYYITLNGGESVENAIDSMLTSSSNTTSSTIKSYIDTWYSETLSSVEANLEDAVWCNDREIYQLGGWDPNGGNPTGGYDLIFKSYQRIYLFEYPRLTCNSINDSFTKSSANGNGSLSNPVGLLTIDETLLAGLRNTNNNYLYTNQAYWLISPYQFSSFNDSVVNAYVYSNGQLIYGYNKIDKDYGVRPAVSLKPGGTWSGDGTQDSPYTVTYS